MALDCLVEKSAKYSLAKDGPCFKRLSDFVAKYLPSKPKKLPSEQRKKATAMKRFKPVERLLNQQHLHCCPAQRSLAPWSSKYFFG